MENIFRLFERSSPQIKELRLLVDKGDVGIYKIFTKWPNAPELDSYMRVIYDDKGIDALDFDGGPFIYPGYSLDEHNKISKIYEDKITKEYLIEVKDSNIEGNLVNKVGKIGY